MPGSQIQRLSQDGRLRDLSGEFVSRFIEFIEAGNVGGKQLVFPYQLVFNIPVYNAGLLEENGIDGGPRRLGELLRPATPSRGRHCPR